MSPLKEVITNKQANINPIWIMRQAGRYLPEFREIRKQNPDFIKLCLNEDLSSEITLQPLKRFDLDAAIIFSDILMLPYGLNQKVEFKKNFGPQLGSLNLENISKIRKKEFSKKLSPIYKAIEKIKNITFKPEAGKTYNVSVIKILDFGAVVEFVPGNEVLLHISEISWERTNKVEDVLKIGDTLDVKYFGIDPKTRKPKVSRKALLDRPDRKN